MPYKFEQEDKLIPDGEYEVRIEEIGQKTTPNGKRKIGIMYRFRDDVEQGQKNSVLFDDVWAEKEDPGYYNRKKLNKILATQKLENGHVFETIDDIIKFLSGANLVIAVRRSFDDYLGADRNYVSYYKPSKAQPKKLGDVAPAQPAQPAKPAADALVLDDEDLPF